jgi:pimeloyl-ACP methyl ester carboxylesterase
VHVVELKGFGDAPKPLDDGYGLQDQASLLRRWILAADLRDITLVGHSLGGGVALLTAMGLLEKPFARIRRLVLLAGIAYRQPVSPYLRLLATPGVGPLLLWALPRRRLIRAALRMAYHPSHPVDESLVEAYARPLRSLAGRRALSRSAAALFSAQVSLPSDGYSRIQVPSLLIWGREDPVVPLWVGERLASELRTAELKILEGCGHMPQEEAAEESLEVLLRFLDKTAQGA